MSQARRTRYFARSATRARSARRGKEKNKAWLIKRLSCRLLRYAQTDATTANIVGPTMLRVASVLAVSQWCANGCNNSQQCWDLQCIVERIQPVRLSERSCVMRVRGPNNVRRAVETDTTCDIMGVVSQQCYVRLHGALIYWSHLRLPTTD